MNDILREHVYKFDHYCNECVYKDEVPPESLPCRDCLNYTENKRRKKKTIKEIKQDIMDALLS